LIQGTIRENLDPFEAKDDVEIWDVLESVNLKEKINNMNEKLETELSNGSSVFSAGEKQLLCLGRAMLLRTKIMVLDEATANVDLETDS
jgi:ABC-type multidrug transport system fused ATPase/permease subunit